jgi:hypothetical protein
LIETCPAPSLPLLSFNDTKCSKATDLLA